MEFTTGFARVGPDRISYRVLGSGPVDLVVTMGSFGSFDAVGGDPEAEVYLNELTSFSRCIQFDRRGTGGSDPVPLDALPPLESTAEEMTAVMDAVGSRRAAIFASYNAGAAALLFASTLPERTEALILYNTTARFLWAPDYEFGIQPEAADQLVETIGRVWGTEAHAGLFVPSRADDPVFLSWFARMLRRSLPPTAAQTNVRNMFATDVRPLLGSISVPTLVIHRAGFALVPADHGRYLASHIAGAEYLELEGADAPLIWQGSGRAVEAIEEFLGRTRRSVPVSRVLSTVLFTDIVESTARARELGDRHWKSLIDVHDDIGASTIAAHHGHLVKTTGDGFLATFDGPGRAIRCALDLRERLRPLHLDIRVGIHTGEVELRGGDVGGIAVHLAARVMAAAEPDEVLVSQTVRDLVAGADLTLVDRGAHRLRGIDREWQLYAVDGRKSDLSPAR